MADPDIGIGAISCGGSRHSDRGNVICFPLSNVYFFVGGRPKYIANLDGGAMVGFVSL